MIFDSQLQLSDAQAITASAATTNYINMTNIRRIGAGEPMVMLIVPTVAADFTTGDETYTFALQIDDNTGFSSATTIQSNAILATALTAGSKHVVNIPLTMPGTGEIYLRGFATLAGTTPSITFDAHIVPQNFVAQYEDYPSGSTITSN